MTSIIMREKIKLLKKMYGLHLLENIMYNIMFKIELSIIKKYMYK